MSDQPEDIAEGQSEIDLEKVMQGSIARLMEFFDTVHIFVTKYDHESKGTYGLTQGEGNYHARFGSIFNWLEEQKAMMRNLQRDNDEDGDDDGDGATVDYEP